MRPVPASFHTETLEKSLFLAFEIESDIMIWSLKSPSVLDTYSMKTNILLHFEHKNYFTIIVKLLYRATSRRRVAL